MTPFQLWACDFERYLKDTGRANNQGEMGALIGVSQGTVSRWTKPKPGESPPDPTISSVIAANRAAEMAGYPIFDWTNGAASQPSELSTLWGRLTEPQRQRIVAFAEGMLADQPPPPAPQPPPVAPSNRVTPRFKIQPELPTIGQGGTVRYYLLDWMDHRNMEPEDLVKRLPDWDLADLKRVLAGRFEPPADLIHYAAKALRTSEEKLRELPPKTEAKPAKKDGKRAKR